MHKAEYCRRYYARNREEISRRRRERRAANREEILACERIKRLARAEARDRVA